MADEIEIELPTADGGWAEIDSGGLRATRPPGGRSPGSRPLRRRRAAGLAAAAAIAVMGVGLALGGQDDRPASPTTAPSPTATVTTGAVAVATEAGPTTTQAFSAGPVGATTTLAATPLFLPGLAVDGNTLAVDGLATASLTGLRLVALGSSGGLYDIDVDAGTVTVANVPTATVSGAPTWLAAGPDWVVVRPYDVLDSYLLRTGKPPVPLTGLLDHGTPIMLRGPGDTLWIEAANAPNGRATINLVGLDGATIGPAVARVDLQVLGTDGQGGLLVRGTGGVYELGLGPDPATPTRVTSGEVLAASPGHLVVVECDDALRCTRWLADRATGERTDLGPERPRGYGEFTGSISPDGRHAVVLRTDGLRRWEEVGLTAPGVVQVAVPLLSLDPEQPATIAWSTDSRYLVYLGASRLWLFDTTTATDRPLVPVEAGFPDVAAFVARSAG